MQRRHQHRIDPTVPQRPIRARTLGCDRLVCEDRRTIAGNRSAHGVRAAIGVAVRGIGWFDRGNAGFVVRNPILLRRRDAIAITTLP